MRVKRTGVRIIGVLVVGLAMLAGTGGNAKAQTWCDPNYGMTPGGCVPGDRDYDCPELKAMGIGDIPVIGTDWQRLDGYYDYNLGQWTAYPDGVGCDWGGE